MMSLQHPTAECGRSLLKANEASEASACSKNERIVKSARGAGHGRLHTTQAQQTLSLVITPLYFMGSCESWATPKCFIVPLGVF